MSASTPAPFPGQAPFALPSFPRGGYDGRYVFVVARILDGYVLYCGRMLYAAAQHLEPGTCYAAAQDEATAIDLAWQLARWFRDRQRRRENTPDGSGHAPEGRRDDTGSTGTTA